ncbi:hypothetical protein F3Y22_tig00111086pilonHSYRG00029 [Hibiscus syriacus]|uniref:Uncharacterized protein n=1 Tax=Hibiscus syriacus TaxID=106335 RepID=A0A6A2Z4R5_HIBSY|nr:hypothetical protein F3Y22_tig00111086pilonHSYRG00029 [Hibiscus syriacus]
MQSGNRRKLTLFEQMMAVDNGRDALAGLTLETILGISNRPEQPPAAQSRTLLEIIRDDESNREKKSWKTLRTSSGSSDRSLSGPPRTMSLSDVIVDAPREVIRVRNNRFRNDVGLWSNAPPSRSFRTEITARNGAGSSEDDYSPMARNETRQLGTVLALDRALSERESAAEDPVRMSLMEFLQETDLIGPRHTTVNAGDDEENEEKERWQRA